MTENDDPGRKRSSDFSIEQRTELLEELRNSGLHGAAFADQKGISRRTVQAWLRFEKTPPEQRTEWRHRGPYSASERKKTVEAFYKSNMLQRDFAHTWGVSVSTLCVWLSRYESGGYSALDDYSPAKSGDRRRGSKVPAVVRQEIVSVKKREPWFGLRKIRDWLLRFRGIKVSTGTIRKTILTEGLPLAIPKRKRRRSADKVRRFERAVPMQLWQSDITSFTLKRHSTRVYLTVFMDDHSRYIVGWRLQTRQNADIVLESFKEAISKFGKPQEVLTDQGRQYFAWRGKSEFEILLEKEGIKHVVSRAHHPETLGKCERFWKTVENEFWTRTRPEDLDEAKLRFKYFVDHYNHQRPHQGLGGASPADRFFGIADEVRHAIEKTLDENALRFAVGELPKPPAFLIGQIGDQRIAFHGSSGNFFLTHETSGEFNDIGTSNSGSAINSPNASKEASRAGASADDLGGEASQTVSGDSGSRSLGSGVGRGENESTREVGGAHGVLGRSNHFGGSALEIESDPAKVLADESTSGRGRIGGLVDTAAKEDGRIGGENEFRRRPEEIASEDQRT